MASRRIPEDLVIDILKRLPVKSLLRFKATSKRWYALISCRNFIKSHLSSAPDRVLILNHTKKSRFFLFPDDDDDESRAVNLNTDGIEPVIDFNQFGNPSAGFVSCDGIVCLFGGFIYNESRPIIPITLWNPATRKFKSLPASNYSASIDKIGARWDVGFGFDSKTDDYKVVAIISLWEELKRFPLEPFMNYVEVYSLKTNSWRVIVAPNAPILEFPTRSTYTQGMYYWMVRDIVSFDMEEEVFRVTPAPPRKSRPFTGLASMNESLVVMYYSYYFPIEVWTTKDLLTLGGDCWTLQYIMEPPAGVQFYDPYLHLLGFRKNCLLYLQGEDYLLKCYGREFFLYDQVTGEVRDLQIPGGIAMLKTSSYKETLVSLA